MLSKLKYWPCSIVPLYDSSIGYATLMPLPGVIKTVETVTLQVPNGSKAMRFIFPIHCPIVEALMKRQPQQTHFMAHLTKVDFLKELLYSL